ncbi:MAG TPA: NAD(P)H-hydrate epimerase [Lacipirellulaceae bacterium]
MNSFTLTRDECRKLDHLATADYGIPSIVLMENAGRGCVDVLERLGLNGSVAILCGKGNNAGDGFVIARHLEIRGYECRVILLCPPGELRGDAATNFAILQKCGSRIIDLSQPIAGQPEVGAASRAADPPRLGRPTSELDNLLNQHASGATWLIDAMLGTGAVGEPRSPFDAAIDWINRRHANTQVLAVDLPSGLDCDTGQPATHTVRADHTCTFAAMKTGFAHPPANSVLGKIHVCDIGLPPRLIDEAVNQSP